MKRNLFALFSILVVLALALSACQPAAPIEKLSDPNEILKRSAEAAQEMKSAKMDFTIAITTGGMNLSFKGEGVVKMPDQSYVKMNMMGQNYETLMISKDEMYVRVSSDGPWTKMDISSAAQPGMNPDFFGQQEAMLSLYQNPTLLGVETVDGVEAYHIAFTMDLQQVLNVTAAQTPELQDMSGTARGEVWIGVADLLTRKSVISMDYLFQGIQAVMDMTMQIKDINKPVDIPKP